jgi:hypothetical protein
LGRSFYYFPIPNYSNIHNRFVSPEYRISAVARSALQPGDWVRFWNRAGYKDQQPRGWYNAENTVMAGADSYYGWGQAPQSNPTAGGETMSYAQWKQELVDAYNSGLGYFVSVRDKQG